MLLTSFIRKSNGYCCIKKQMVLCTIFMQPFVMKKLCTKRIYLFLYSIVLFPNIYFTISQGTPHYPVKGKNDYPISNRE